MGGCLLAWRGSAASAQQKHAAERCVPQRGCPPGSAVSAQQKHARERCVPQRGCPPGSAGIAEHSLPASVPPVLFSCFPFSLFLSSFSMQELLAYTPARPGGYTPPKSCYSGGGCTTPSRKSHAAAAEGGVMCPPHRAAALVVTAQNHDSRVLLTQ